MTSRACILTLALVTILLFIPSLFADFVFDDRYLILENPFVKNLRSLERAFTADYYGQANEQYALGYYRPLSLVSHWMDWQIWGARSAGHHLTNLIIHLLAVILLFSMMLQFFQSVPLAFFTALVFAVHPVHAGTITFVSGRVDAIATVFVLVSLIAFGNRTALSAVAYAAGLLSKEMSVTVPVLAWWKERKRGFGSAFLTIVPLLVVLAVILAIRLSILQSSFSGIPEDLFARIARAPLVLAGYLRFLVLPPAQLYFEPTPGIFPPWLIAVSVVLFLAGAMYLQHREARKLVFVWWITFLPILGFLRLETSMDERFLYLPSISFCLLFGAIADQYLFARSRESNSLPDRKRMLAAALVIVLAYAPFTLLRQLYWQNDMTLWTAASESDPQSGRTRLRLGIALLENGDAHEAREQLQAALKDRSQPRPIRAAIYTHLGVVNQVLGDSSKVETLHRNAIELVPDYYTAHYNLGLFYEAHGRTTEAIDAFQNAAKANPLSPAAHRSLARVLQRAGRNEEAVRARSIADSLEQY